MSKAAARAGETELEGFGRRLKSSVCRMGGSSCYRPENAGFARGTDECVRPYTSLFLAESLAGVDAVALDEVAGCRSLFAFQLEFEDFE
jgi:hypothetical protein